MSANNPYQDAGDRERERNAARSRERTQSAADIGDMPGVVDRERKERCRTDLHEFLVTYFPESTGLKPFSEGHKRVIGRIQRCILFGEKLAEAVFRGWAKTTIAENACVWAAVYGHQKFVVLLGADKDASENNLSSIKTELSSNELLLEDFPEVCFPIRALEGRPQRCQTQSFNGELTHLGWTANDVVLPTIPGSDASGACIRTKGIMACNRGMTHKTPSGKQERPGFVFVDDPQTDESAQSVSQVQKRLNKLYKTVMKLAGHSKPIAIVIAGTVIQKGDFMDTLLDPEKSPAWQSERIKMVEEWADDHESFWLGEYAELRNTYDRENPSDQQRAKREAGQFYLDNQDRADAGCKIAWVHCFDEDNEHSAIQHAYNMLIDDGPEVFASECQNDPMDDRSGSDERIEREKLPELISHHLKRRIVPDAADRITHFCDVQGNMIWGVTASFSSDWDMSVLDYGAYPKQKRPYYTRKDVSETIQKMTPDRSYEEQLYAALEQHTEEILGSSWTTEEGTERYVDLMLIDANWGESTETVYRFCKESKYAARLLPSHGRPVGPGDQQISDRKTVKTDRGFWNGCRRASRRGSQYVIFDASRYKTFAMKRINTPKGGKGTVSVFKGTPQSHRLFFDHLVSEYPVDVEVDGTSMKLWKGVPNRDNEGFDGFVGSIVAACASGLMMPGDKPAKKRRKRGHVRRF